MERMKRRMQKQKVVWPWLIEHYCCEKDSGDQFGNSVSLASIAAFVAFYCNLFYYK